MLLLLSVLQGDTQLATAFESERVGENHIVLVCIVHSVGAFWFAMGVQSLDARAFGNARSDHVSHEVKS